MINILEKEEILDLMNELGKTTKKQIKYYII